MKDTRIAPAGEPSGNESSETDAIESLILAFIHRELVSPERGVRRDDDLLSGELLDSVAVLRLAAFVGEEFRMEMQPADFVVENFQNVEVLTRYVRRSTEPAATDAEH